MPPRIYVGTSGFHYDHWKERFYPADLPRSRWLEFYARHFQTVELNNTFYRLPSEKTFAVWRESSPRGFIYALKVSRFITHIKRLRDVKDALDNFLGRARLLGDKLGPLLYQIPPNMRPHEAVLEDFLSLLPPDLSHAFEFRHQAWLSDRMLDILKAHKVGFCIYDMPGLTTPVVATADFAYVRFHGSQWLYGSCYSDSELSDWAERISEISRNLKAVYIYFNNDAEAFAVSNALTLAAKLGAEKTA